MFLRLPSIFLGIASGFIGWWNSFKLSEWWSFWGNGIRLAIVPFLYLGMGLQSLSFLLRGSSEYDMQDLLPPLFLLTFVIYVPCTFLMLLTRDPYVDNADSLWKLLSKHEKYRARYMTLSGATMMIGLVLVFIASFPVAFYLSSPWQDVVAMMYGYLIVPILAMTFITWHCLLISFTEEFETPDDLYEEDDPQFKRHS